MSDASDARQLVVFTLAGEHYALPIHEVHEIIRYIEPRSVAAVAAWVRGVISLRGRIVPVYDIGARLGISCQPTEQCKIVIVEAGAETAGVVVDEVEEVLTVSEEALEPAPAADATLIDSIAKVGERLIVLLRLDALFAQAEPAAA